MKINPTTMVNAYLKTNPTRSTTRTTPINQAGGFMEVLSSKMDTISISQNGMVSGITKDIMGNLADMNSSGRIQELQEAVRSGSYSVSVEELAGAMMQRAVI